MKRLIVLIAVSIVTLVAGWYQWTGSVRYSLQQIQHAITTHDRYLFEKHVDIDNFLDRLVDDLIREQGGQDDAGLFSDMKEKYVKEFKKDLLRGIESAGASAAPQEEDVAGLITGRGGIIASVPAILLSKAKITRTGRSAVLKVSGRVEGAPISRQEKALLSIKADRMDIPFVVQLRLVQTPFRYWRLTEFINLADILNVRTKAAVNAAIEEKLVLPEDDGMEQEAKIKHEAEQQLDNARQTYRMGVEKRLSQIMDDVGEQYLKTIMRAEVIALSGQTTVRLALVLTKEGRVKSLTIGSTPTNDALKQEIEQAILRSEPLGPFPESLTEDEFSMWFSKTLNL